VTRTAEQRRAEDRIMYDAFMAACPTRQVFATIGDKWAGLAVNALAGGPMRHGELRARIAGASQKMLTQTLRTLERDGLVTRTVTPSVPVRVDYELTPLGHTLVPILRALKDWSETHIGEILEARDDYDAKTAAAAG
jgi:DNA-binding HxlR family transcriptional regulator